MFKEGDLVVIARSSIDFDPYKKYIGTIGVVTHVYKTLKRNEYKIDSTHDVVWFENELEPVIKKSFNDIDSIKI